MIEIQKAAKEFGKRNGCRKVTLENHTYDSHLEQAFIEGAIYEREQHKGDKVSKYMAEAERAEQELSQAMDDVKSLRSRLARALWALRLLQQMSAGKTMRLPIYAVACQAIFNNMEARKGKS